PDPVFTDSLELDLGAVEPSLAGPKRPQDRIALSKASMAFDKAFETLSGRDERRESPVAGADYALPDGAVVIAAITSCTNTSNPSVLVGAGLVARKARERGLSVKPWVKTSFAPGSQVVTDYLEAGDLQADLDALGFNLVGYGCTTCIGNSGPLPEAIGKAVEAEDLTVCAVLSGNRNFEGRIHAQVKANYLASPPLVVAYALAGSMDIDVTKDPLGEGSDGKPVYLKDIWPTNAEIREVIDAVLTPEMFLDRYADVFKGDADWQGMGSEDGRTYDWQPGSTYVRNPPFFEGMGAEAEDLEEVRNARILMVLGDSVTTDHISPAGAIKADSPAGEYLIEHGVEPREFNSYGSRRGNHEVMMRGTFANIRIRNEMTPDIVGGVTKHMPDGAVMPVYDAAMKYQDEGVPLVIFAGKEYGTGSSRDWAAKGTRLLGVKAVVVESFERIHRSNLIGMGVLPLQFPEGTNRETLSLDGSETVDIAGFAGGIEPGMTVECTIRRADGNSMSVNLICRIDTVDEVEYFRSGGILHYVLRNILAAA
ncbi:MAG: aconitate hydratase AcnA, partial [Rhodospirillaceae bacterium]|nr:aconitate hydratase AcnA [Rhodospirillaceae bacterium]